METLQEVFSSAGITVAVVFVDDDNATHLTPNCEKIVGETRVVTDLSQRGNWVCSCIPVPVPTSERIAGPNTDHTSHSGNGSNSNHNAPEWPEDLPKPSDDNGLNSIESVEGWLATVNRKLEPSDINAIPSLKTVATTYVMQAAKDDPSNEFMVSVANACARYDITAGQAKGVLNWWRAQVKRNGPKQTSYVQGTNTFDENNIATGNASDISNVPNGIYLIDGVELKVNKPKGGGWQGFTFINDNADRSKVALQGPYNKVAKVSAHNELVSKLVENPLAYAIAYGKATGRCGICSKELTDPVSIAAGIGPVCASKF